MLIVPLGGFLGAGKTTTMLAAARLLETRGETVSVVTNDQGVDLVDTEAARAASVGAVGEVTGGCFCCRFDDLVGVLSRLRDEAAPTVVLTEAVGSCSDLRSTVVEPLRRLHGDEFNVAPLTVLVDPVRYVAVSRSWQQPGGEPDLAYLYRHQLDEADVVAVNKADLLDADGASRVRAELAHRFPAAHVVTLSARTGTGLDALVDLWTAPDAGADAVRPAPFALDYDRYGAAEAELAWTNQTLRVASADGQPFTPVTWVERFAGAFSDEMTRAGRVVGHVKLRLTTPEGVTKVSLTGSVPSYDEQQWAPAGAAEVVLNARVQTTPDDLDAVIERCVAVADVAVGTASTGRRGDVFRPSYPTPTHRM